MCLNEAYTKVWIGEHVSYTEFHTPTNALLYTIKY